MGLARAQRRLRQAHRRLVHRRRSSASQPRPLRLQLAACLVEERLRRLPPSPSALRLHQSLQHQQRLPSHSAGQLPQRLLLAPPLLPPLADSSRLPPSQLKQDCSAHRQQERRRQLGRRVLQRRCSVEARQQEEDSLAGSARRTLRRARQPQRSPLRRSASVHLPRRRLQLRPPHLPQRLPASLAARQQRNLPRRRSRCSVPHLQQVLRLLRLSLALSLPSPLLRPPERVRPRLPLSLVAWLLS